MAAKAGRDITFRELVDDPAFFDLYTFHGVRRFLCDHLCLIVIGRRYEWIVIGSTENAARCLAWLAKNAPDSLEEIADEEGVSVDQLAADVEDSIEPTTYPVFCFGYDDAIGHDEQALCELDPISGEDAK